MIHDSDIEHIIKDLSKLLSHHKANENYEACRDIKGLIDKLSNYLSSDDAEYETVVDDLFEICVQRYILYRMIVVDKERFVSFILPNGNAAYFWIDSTDDESNDWELLREAYQKDGITIENNLREYIKEVKQNS